MAFSSHLQEAIKSTTLEHLQTVLLSMCSKSEEVSRLASNELLVENSTVKVPKPYDDHPQLPKEVCAQCREEFVPALNKSDSCQWHDGELEYDIDRGYWDEWDEPPHDDEFDQMVKHHPDGFIWSCCDTLGNGGKYFLRDHDCNCVKVDVDESDVKGCLRGPHRTAKDRKYSAH